MNLQKFYDPASAGLWTASYVYQKIIPITLCLKKLNFLPKIEVLQKTFDFRS